MSSFALSAKKYLFGMIAREISSIARYFSQTIQWQKLPWDDSCLLEQIETKSKNEFQKLTELPGYLNEKNNPSLYLLNANINHTDDVADLLQELKTHLSRSSRLCLVCYNPYLSFVYRILKILGLREAPLPTTFVTRTMLQNVTKLTGFEVVRERYVGFFPFDLYGTGVWINKICSVLPLIKRFSFAYLAILRPEISYNLQQLPTLSIVVPARNEAGNIENLMKRLPYFSGQTPEIIFVEGHSKDHTWSEIQRVAELYSDRFTIKTLQQSGIGKADAVRQGFAEASGELLTILDADLSMPPEKLESFYFAWVNGHGDFINGNRLAYKMEAEAMRPLNHLANILFAKMLGYVLDTRLGDSLCGTKLLSKADYQRFIEWRKDFGDFDPFGDFELIFPASILGLGTVDLPIKYRSRTYGATNISRFRHGLMLLKMTIIGFFKIKPTA